MKDLNSKARLQGQRGHTVHTRPWTSIIEHYREHGGPAFSPMVRLVEALSASPDSSQLFGGTSMFTLLLSDTEDFRSGDSTLHITYDPAEHRFEFWHRAFSGHDDRKTCGEDEVLQTLKLFLRLKYGVLLEPSR